jgi:hypothetical protein
VGGRSGSRSRPPRSRSSRRSQRRGRDSNPRHGSHPCHDLVHRCHPHQARACLAPRPRDPCCLRRLPARLDVADRSARRRRRDRLPRQRPRAQWRPEGRARGSAVLSRRLLAPAHAGHVPCRFTGVGLSARARRQRAPRGVAGAAPVPRDRAAHARRGAPRGGRRARRCELPRGVDALTGRTVGERPLPADLRVAPAFGGSASAGGRRGGLAHSGCLRRSRGRIVGGARPHGGCGGRLRRSDRLAGGAPPSVRPCRGCVRGGARCRLPGGPAAQPLPPGRELRRAGIERGDGALRSSAVDRWRRRGPRQLRWTAVVRRDVDVRAGARHSDLASRRSGSCW